MLSEIYEQDPVKVGDEVKVKVLSIEEETNRIALSIRAALPKPERPERPKQQGFKNRDSKPNYEKSSSYDNRNASRTPSNDFEDIMKDFLKQSNDKMAALNKRANKRG